MGRENFRRSHGFGRAKTYELVLDGVRYDSKAIAGVAHLYSVGSPLSAGDFSGGARTVAHRLRALGFTVEDGTAGEDGPRQAAAQLVLQPRGGARHRGRQNFVKSVRRGVEIATLEDALGEQADVLAALYPDGIARLWGATPTQQANNEKVKALRNRRVGDDVLFYTENHFIARARIIHLFDSAQVAQAVWGIDEGNATWEHIMALGDVEEFSTPVLAAPILRILNVRAPLRSLTLRSAEDYRRVVDQLPERRQSLLSAPSVTPPAASYPRLTAGDLLDRIGSLNTHRHPKHRAPSRHQPLALLWAISRIAAGKPRLAPWAQFSTEVRPLLAEFGLPNSKITPEYPFWHLQGNDLWEVHGIPSEAGPMPQVGVFNAVQPVAGLTYETAELLQNPLVRLQAVVKLCSTYLDGVDQRVLLSKVGLAGYATADGLLDGVGDDHSEELPDEERAPGATARRDVTTSRLVRDSALAKKVKELHDHSCQVCGTRLQYKGRPYSQASHIRGLGSPHDGPDELPNLLCLCPNHHVLFDGLEIYIDADGVVRQTQGDESLGLLRRHAGHRIDETYLRYHRTLCELTKLAGE
ncbi:HNH endonuclease [Streptomyces sparsogenes]|uniref:HNH nuclease domain-containing protein n=1 Tax=Streptomyces cuspidosporus TaxID=66882 RepID=A0ABP5T0A7_9ACTN